MRWVLIRRLSLTITLTLSAKSPVTEVSPAAVSTCEKRVWTVAVESAQPGGATRV